MKKRFRCPSRIINSLYMLLALFCFVYYILNGVFIRFAQSLLWVWPVIGVLLLIRWALAFKTIRSRKTTKKRKYLLRFLNISIAFTVALFVYVESFVVAGAFASPPPSLDYIIVLGAKVNGTSPSGALRNRIALAHEYLTENPETIVIASGGQGPDEGISEAECIRLGLTQRGISEERILMEDQSTSTLENILFSMRLIEDENAEIGIVTNNYHMYRAIQIANHAENRRFEPLPVATSLLSLPHGLMREFAAVIVGKLSGDF